MKNNYILKLTPDELEAVFSMVSTARRLNNQPTAVVIDAHTKLIDLQKRAAVDRKKFIDSLWLLNGDQTIMAGDMVHWLEDVGATWVEATPYIGQTAKEFRAHNPSFQAARPAQKPYRAPTPASRVRRYLRLRERGAVLYKRADEEFSQLQLALGDFLGKPVEVNGKTYGIVDNFAASNVAFRPAKIARFELKELKEVKKK